PSAQIGIRNEENTNSRNSPNERNASSGRSIPRKPRRATNIPQPINGSRIITVFIDQNSRRNENRNSVTNERQELILLVSPAAGIRTPPPPLHPGCTSAVPNAVPPRPSPAPGHRNPPTAASGPGS